MINERLESALSWCKKNKVKNQLELFNRVEKKPKKKRSKKDKGELNEKEFKQMCKKARVDRKALCNTVFTRNIRK